MYPILARWEPHAHKHALSRTVYRGFSNTSMFPRQSLSARPFCLGVLYRTTFEKLPWLVSVLKLEMTFEIL